MKNDKICIDKNYIKGVAVGATVGSIVATGVALLVTKRPISVRYKDFSFESFDEDRPKKTVEKIEDKDIGV